MKLWERVRGLRFEVEDFSLEGLQVDVSSGFRRLTTVVVLRGPNACEGRGEDVSYGREDQEAFRRHGPGLRADLVGAWTLEEFSARLDELELFVGEPDQPAYRDYRRWAFESAAFDLAAQQNDIGIEAAFGRSRGPLHYVVSMRLPEPPTVAPLVELRTRYPGVRFKLDLEASWDQVFMRELHDLGAVDVIDLKGMYEGTVVDLAPDPEAYAAVAESMPRVLIEDPKLDSRTRAVLADAIDRITWDAPIHSVDDVTALADVPEALNSKPSRFGTWRRLLEFYEHCEQHGIRLYAGGQFELGVGRDHIQCLAALFHPDACNDCAPRGFNAHPISDDLPGTPWDLPLADRGFGFESSVE